MNRMFPRPSRPPFAAFVAAAVPVALFAAAWLPASKRRCSIISFVPSFVVTGTVSRTPPSDAVRSTAGSAGRAAAVDVAPAPADVAP